MAIETINKYISERYERWLDYARYHCSHAKMEDEAIDVLNEVLAMLIEKYHSNADYIMRLHESKKGQYRELDFFILQMIKLNIQSPTSPYRYKYKSLPIDANVESQQLDVIDEEDDDIDRSGLILEQMQKVREIFESLDLSPRARKIFSFKFFEGNSFSEWDEKDDPKNLYSIYNGVIELIKDKLDGMELF